MTPEERITALENKCALYAASLKRADKVNETLRMEIDEQRKVNARLVEAVAAAASELDNPPDASHLEMARRNVNAWKLLVDALTASKWPYRPDGRTRSPRQGEAMRTWADKVNETLRMEIDEQREVNTKLLEACRALVGFGPPKNGNTAWELAVAAIAAAEGR